MTVILVDVEADVPVQFAQCKDITYWDDTALVSDSTECLQVVLDSLVSHARSFGLEPNGGKTVHMQIKHDAHLAGPGGQPVKCVEQAVYLGGLLRTDGSTQVSITRRLGQARAAFDKLVSVWRHANITAKRKLLVFNACVVSALLYSLETICMRKADKDRIDAFQAKCLRQIFKILHSMISHVSNATILAKAGAKPLSSRLLSRQLHFYGRLASLPATSLLRQAVLQPNTAVPLELSGKRRRGRPRLSWFSVLFAQALKLAGGSPAALNEMLCGASATPHGWRLAVCDFCNRQQVGS
ncbi:unnamed protein product [Polarella glacialis]|uniref:Reverse transcriptase domain-containing protein n=1 Tax=Polarella glacialis TaxID=89957 RepID=A0A813G159_POLGL|nr:unnamed protein product [Polarella glacialis]